MSEWAQPFDVMGMLRLGADRSGVPGWEPDALPPGGLVLNLGAGEKRIQLSVALDLPEWDGDKDDIPYPDESVTTIYALHFLEHLRDPIRMLRECQRVLKPGGHLNVVVPHYSGQLAYSDLDHKTFWDTETWERLFDNPYYDKDHKGWRFRIGTNILMGVAERNLLVITQLIKREV